MTDWLNLPSSVSRSQKGLCEFVTSDFGHLYVPARVLYQGRTRFQEMVILETPTFGRLLFLDGKVQVSYLDEERYHQYLVQGPLLCCEAPERIYIIGGGDGGALEEAAKHPGLSKIVMAELDREVVEKSKEFLPEISKGAFEDPRLELRFVDALEDLRQTRERYDAIIVDLTEPHGPSKMLYTREFYEMLAGRLTPGGAIGVHTDNYDLFPEAYGTIYHTLEAVFGERLATARVGMPCFGMDWSFRIASLQPIDPVRLADRFRQAVAAGISLEAFHPSTYLLEPTERERAVLKTHRRISTDRDPFDKFLTAPSYITNSADEG